jgi:hypothetical protein
MLNHPGDSLVLQADFLYMVERVDLCIEYLRAHVCKLLLIVYTYADAGQRGTIAKQKFTFSGSNNA